MLRHYFLVRWRESSRRVRKRIWRSECSTCRSKCCLPLAAKNDTNRNRTEHQSNAWPSKQQSETRVGQRKCPTSQFVALSHHIMLPVSIALAYCHTSFRATNNDKKCPILAICSQSAYNIVSIKYKIFVWRKGWRRRRWRRREERMAILDVHWNSCEKV